MLWGSRNLQASKLAVPSSAVASTRRVQKVPTRLMSSMSCVPTNFNCLKNDIDWFVTLCSNRHILTEKSCSVANRTPSTSCSTLQRMTQDVEKITVTSNIPCPAAPKMCEEPHGLNVQGAQVWRPRVTSRSSRQQNTVAL